MTQDQSIPYTPPLATWQPPSEVWQPQVPGPPYVEPIPAISAASIVVASFGAGLLGQLLFLDQTGGVNLPIWVGTVLAAAFTLRGVDARLSRHDAWLPLAALVFASFVAIRDDAGLFLFDFVAAAALTLASVVAIGGISISTRQWAAINALGGGALLAVFGGAAKLGAGAAELARIVPLGHDSTTARIGRGLLIAVPLVLFFALLLGAADAVFAKIVSNVLRVDVSVSELVARLLVAAALGWVFAGTMVATRLSRRRFADQNTAAGATDATAYRLGTVETIVVLVALDLLFAAFVIVQAAYLFPGSDPLAVSGMTYSEYARRGFFELVAAAMLAGLVILWLDRVVERRSRTYRATAAGLVVLIGVVLVSAAVRLDLYQQAYGWTELRFYVLAAIGWLALGVVAALVALAVGRVSSLPKVMFAGGLGVALVCNAIGPQAFATEQNFQRIVNPALVSEGGYSGLDTGYLLSLGADSISVVIANLDRVPPRDEASLRAALHVGARELRATYDTKGWPSWNLSKEHALDALTAAGF